MTYITDNVMPAHHIPLHPEFYGAYCYEPEYQAQPPSRLFNCFINRICPNRQAWFYQFIRHDLLDKGNVSFLVGTSRAPFDVYKDPVSANDAVFETCNHIFQEEHDRIREKVPFCNFTVDLDQAIVDTKISLVLETYFDNPNISFSEKTFRALQLPRPLVMFNYPGAISVLRDYGFDVWDDIVDHGYDSISDDRRREQMILGEIMRFGPIEFSNSQLENFETKAMSNRLLLQTLKEKWPERLKSVIETIKQ